MLRAVKRQFLVQWDDWILMGIIALAGVLIGDVMIYLLSAEEGMEDFFSLGITMGIILSVFYSAISTGTGIATYFNVEVSMGCTRKEFFVSYFLVSFLGNMIGVLWLALLCGAENLFVRVLAPNWGQAMNFLPYLWKFGIPAALAVPMIAGPRILTAMEEAPDSIYGTIGTALASMVKAVPGNIWIILGTAVSLVCLAGTYLLLRKQSVTV